jgi:hypothetical protein
MTYIFQGTSTVIQDIMNFWRNHPQEFQLVKTRMKREEVNLKIKFNKEYLIWGMKSNKEALLRT